MEALNLARQIVQDQPDLSEPLLLLLIWSTSLRDDPIHEAQLDAVKEMLYAKTPDGVKHRESFQKAQLIRLVPESESSTG